jgi:phage gp29-like protein
MDFLGWFKNKLTPAAVSTQQTDSPQAALLHKEFDNHPSKGLTPAKLARIMLDAEQGDMIAQAELFMDMEEKDTHIGSELGKRKMAVKKLDWSLSPPRNATATEKKNTRALEDLIRDEIDVGAIRLDMLDAIGHGYSCTELGWGRNTLGKWYPNQIEHRPPTWFTSPLDNRNTLHLRDNSNFYGVPLQPFGWIAHIHKTRSGYLARAGLHRSLVWPYLYKNYSVRDLAEFLEIYGLPIRLGKYPASAKDTEKNDLLRAVLSIGHHAAGIIPDSMQIELQQVMASGNADSFMVMVNWSEGSVSKAILGGTLTSSTAANGNRSLGDVHNEVRLDIRDDDAGQVDETLSGQLVYPMAMLNGLFADNRCPRWVSDTQEPDDLALFADAIPKLVAVGVQVPKNYVNTKLKIPLPEDGEAVLGAVMPAVTPPATGLTALAGQVPANTYVDPTPVSSQSNQLAVYADPAIQDWLAVIQDKLNKAESLAAFKEDLLTSYGDLETEKLIKVMGLGFAAADLAGRFDVNEGG